MTRPRSWLDRVYRALLALFPAEFRGDFGDAMAADFADAHAARRGWSVVGLAVRELPGLLVAALRQHVADAVYDSALAWRLMARTPGTAVAIVLMFAVGLGANAAVFSVTDAVLLRSPFQDPSRIALVQERLDRGRVRALNAKPDEVQRLRTMTDIFDSVSPFDLARATLADDGRRLVPRFVRLECTSADIFRVLGVQPALGRAFGAMDDRPGADPVVVVTDAFWRGALGGDRAAVGRRIRLNAHSVTVIGVLPPGVVSVRSLGRTDMWAPVGAATGEPSETGCQNRSGNVYARVRRDLTIPSADARLRALTGGTRGLWSLTESTVGDDRATLLVLEAAVGFVLLIASANVAILLLERFSSRRREMATRLALGASVGRLTRQLLVESLWLATLGTVVGLVVARAAVTSIVSMLPSSVPHAGNIELNGRVVAVTLAAGWVSGLVAGLVPAVMMSRSRLAGMIGETRGATARGTWIRRGLLVTEVSLSVALVVGALLSTRSLIALWPVHPGFDASDKLAVTVWLTWARDRPAEARRQFFNDVRERLAAIPGVAGVSGTSDIPLSGVVTYLPIEIAGEPRAAGGPARVFIAAVTDNYLAEMRMPILRGRGLTPEDTRARVAVAVVNQTLARQLSPDSDPIGREVIVRGTAFDPVAYQVIGVVPDTRLFGSTTHGSPQLFLPFEHSPAYSFTFMMRSSPDRRVSVAPLIRAAVTGVDPTQFVDSITPLEDVLARSVAPWRFVVSLMSAFALIALGLASIGLAAVIAAAVTDRTREIGVRIALGATHHGVVRLMVAQTTGVTLFGIGVGLLLAAGMSRFLAASLYELSPRDPLTFALSAAVVLAASMLASYLPARRATRVDPIVALRCE